MGRHEDGEQGVALLLSQRYRSQRYRSKRFSSRRQPQPTAPLGVCLLMAQAADLDATMRQHQQAQQQQHSAASGFPAAPAAAAEAAAPPVHVSPAAAAAAAREVGAAAALASDLAALFSDPRHPPDIAAAGVAAIHAPQDKGAHAAQSLVRVDLVALRGAARHALGERYLVLPRTLADALGDAPTADARVALLQAAPEGCAVAQGASALAAAIRERRQSGGAGGGAGAAERRSKGFVIPQRA